MANTSPSTEVLGPQSAPRPKLPRVVLAVFGGVLLFDLIFPRPSGFAEGLEVVAILAMVGIGVWTGAWLEERHYAWLRRRGGFLRILLAFTFVGVVVIGGSIAAGLLGAALETLGFGETVILGLLVIVLWMGSAGLGSAIVVVVDAVASNLRDFRTRMLLTVLGLMIVVGLGAGTAAFVIPYAIRAMIENPEKISVDLGGPKLSGAQAADVLSEDGLADLIGLVLVLGLASLFLPAVISAAGKLGDLAMERVRPLDDAFVAVSQGRLDVRVEEGGSIEFARLGRHFNEMVESLSLARSMERAFGAYVSPPVLAKIRAQHGAVEIPPSARTATVFFADVRGFTSMSEQVSPQVLLDVLDRYYDHVVEVVEAHEGYVDKFIGDAIYVVFNGPIDQPDHAERCANCTIEIVRSVAVLNETGVFPEIGSLDIGIGIATGPVVAGSLGSETHAQFSVIGDTVNLASRLTGLAPPGEIWLNAACAEALPDSLSVEPLEPVSVKGKEKPVDVFRLKG